MLKSVAEVKRQPGSSGQNPEDAARVLASIPETVGPEIAEREAARKKRRAAGDRLTELMRKRRQ